MSGLGCLLPGVFPVQRSWDDPAARKIAAVSAQAGLPTFEARLVTMTLVDWYTSERRRDPLEWAERETPEGLTMKVSRPESVTALPLPTYVLDVLDTALPMTAKQRQRHHADEARRLRGTMSVAEIGKRLGRTREHVQRVLFKAEGAPVRIWHSAEDVITAVLDTDDARLVYDAAKWFADRGEPLPFCVWWAVICALGLGKGKLPVLLWRGLPPLNPDELTRPIGARYITDDEREEARADCVALGWSPETVESEVALLGPTAAEVEQECMALGLSAAETNRALEGFDVIRGDAAYGLTDATIEAISGGVRKPEGFAAGAKYVAEALVDEERGISFIWGELPSVYAISKAVAAATDEADRRRGTLRGGNADKSDAINGWKERPDWKRAVSAYKAVARFNPN